MAAGELFGLGRVAEAVSSGWVMPRSPAKAQQVAEGAM